MNASPRFSVVMPATGNHAWDITEGWVKSLEESKILNNVFRPLASWGDCSLSIDDHLLTYLKEAPHDYLILLGIDWHSQPMHHGDLYQLICSRSSMNIGVIWEDYDLPFGLLGDLKLKMMSSWLRASCMADMFITNHESNVNILAPLSCRYAIHYVGFGIDISRYLTNSRNATERRHEIRFSGKVEAWADEPSGGPYALRRKILSSLKDAVSDLRICRGSMSEAEYIDFLMEAKACINLPSFSLSPTLRNYEALCAGSFLITWQGNNSSASHELRKFPNVLFYDPHNPGDVADKCRQVINMDPLEYQEKVTAGAALAHELVSHQARITTITKLLHQKNVTHWHIPEGRSNKLLIIDMVFLQIACNGIAYVWDSIIQSYLDNHGPNSLLLIRRTQRLLRDYGCETVYLPPIDWALSPEEIARSNDEMLARLGITDYAFASTYYTMSEGHFNIQIIHDMIPELLQAKDRIWQHKRACLDYSDMLICVSHSTMIDLIGMDQRYATKTNYITNGLPLLRFQRESRSPIKWDLHTRRSTADHSILYIGGRYGLMGYKNGAVLLKAFQKMIKRVHGKYSVELIFVSHSPSPEPQIQSLLEDLPIHFITADDDELCELYASCDCLVYSSAMEGFGLPILEGLYAGIHVVASDIPPHREASFGFWDEMTFYDPYSPDDLADKLCTVMKTIPRMDKIDRITDRKNSIEQSSLKLWKRFANTLNDVVLTDRRCKAEAITNDTALHRFASLQFKHKQQSIPIYLDSSWKAFHNSQLDQ